MNIEAFDNKILIIKDGLKDNILDFLNKSKKLINIRIITLSELKRKYYFDYDNETIYYVCNKYNVIYDIAKIYIENLYYIKDKTDNEKVNFLYELKQDLISNKLLQENKLFKNSLKNKNIVLYNLKYVDKFYENIFNELESFSKIERINYEHEKSIKELYKCNNVEEEISFVASKICDLVKSGIDINNIKLTNVSSDYYFNINKIFSMFNIPVNLNSSGTAKGCKLVKEFKNSFSSDINSTIESIKKYVKTNNDKKIFKRIIDIINSYNFVPNIEMAKELVFHDIDNIKTNKKIYKNAINIIDIETDIVDDNDYVFLLNYVEGSIPVNNKNEDYLSDEIKNKLGISDSNDLNEKNILSIRDNISKINHLIVTYPEYMDDRKKYISSSYEEGLFKECTPNIDSIHSNEFNKIELLKEKDENKKYGTVSDKLISLNNHYKDEKYMDYDNKYTLIDKDKLFKYLGNELVLSYTSVNSYFECAFKYYLDYVLKLNKYKDSFEIVVGNIFHHILSECFKDDYDIDSAWEKEVKNSDYEFNNMELHFLEKLHEQFKLIVEVIKNQLKYTSLSKTMYEKKFVIDVNKDLHISFKGFADKILYDEVGDETVVVIIDYKTGNPSIDLNKTVYGLGMQLPIYLYLAKNSNEIKNVRIGGFYLQNILNSYSSEEELNNNLKLQGYSNSDIDILRLVDSNYENSHIIKSMRTTSNGFYQYAKLINDEDIDKLSNIIKSKIEEASNKIISSEFDINPKQIGKELVGCRYCKYKDICYMKNEDIISLPKPDNIFGGDENA